MPQGAQVSWFPTPGTSPDLQVQKRSETQQGFRDPAFVRGSEKQKGGNGHRVKLLLYARPGPGHSSASSTSHSTTCKVNATGPH